MNFRAAAMGLRGAAPTLGEHTTTKTKFVVIVCYNKHALFTGAKLRKLWESTKFLERFFFNPKHAGRPKKPYTEKAQSKAIRVIGSIADQVKTINDFIREHPYEEDRVKFLLSSVIEQLK